MISYIKEEFHEKAMKNVVRPYLEARRQTFRVEINDEISLYGEYYRVNEGKGTIMISHGFTEIIEKYHELIYYFLNAGYDVCIHEHRAHGRSATKEEQQAKGQKAVYVDTFESYVEDFRKVVDEVLLDCLPGPYYLYAHSMGGAIGAWYLEKYPETFSKAILNAPMLEINRGGLPYAVAKAMADVLCMVGKEREFLPGQSPFSEIENFEASAATSKVRYSYYFNEQLKDENLRVGGCSCRWALTSFLADEEILKVQNCKKVQIPVLLFQAEKDDFVLPKGQEHFIRRIADGKLIRVANSKHEIYLSTDDVLKPYVNTIVKFLKK